MLLFHRLFPPPKSHLPHVQACARSLFRHNFVTYYKTDAIWTQQIKLLSLMIHILLPGGVCQWGHVIPYLPPLLPRVVLLCNASELHADSLEGWAQHLQLGTLYRHEQSVI